MGCPKCHAPMFVNGRFWQCPGCGWLIPYTGYTPDGHGSDVVNAAHQLRC